MYKLETLLDQGSERGLTLGSFIPGTPKPGLVQTHCGSHASKHTVRYVYQT
jgi:hypothetical protein